MTTNRNGVALLEALIALAILSLAGLGMVSVVSSSLRAQTDLAHREEVMRTGSRVMAAMTLLKPEDLNQRLGTHPLGEFLVGVSRPEKTLYRIALREVQAPEQEILVTVVYRP